MALRRWTAVFTRAAAGTAGVTAGPRGCCSRSSASKDDARAAAVGKRSSGFFSRHLRTVASSSRGTPRPSSVPRDTVVSRCFLAIDRNVRPVNIRRPLRSSNAMAPMA